MELGKTWRLFKNIFFVCSKQARVIRLSLFILVFSWHTTTNHRDSIKYGDANANSKCLLHKKKRNAKTEREGGKGREKKKKVYLRFFSSSSVIYSFIQKDWFFMMIVRHINKENKTSRLYLLLLSRFFCYQLIFTRYNSTKERKHRSMTIVHLNKYFEDAFVYLSKHSNLIIKWKETNSL